MDEAFKDINDMFQSGVLKILKIFFLYIILPEIVGILILGGILRLRGKLLAVSLIGILFIGLYLVVIYGLPELTNMG